MTQSLISQPIPIPTRQISQSISEIQHQQLRLSFSLLSILQPQHNLSSHEKQLKSLTTRQEQQFNKQYLPLPKNHQLTKNSISPKVKSINFHDQKFKRKNQYLGEYFQPTEILTPKMNSNPFHKNIGLLSKSSKKDVSTKKDPSKSTYRSGQKSTKSIQSIKKISKPFNFMKRHQKSPSDYDFQLITSPYSPRVPKKPSKSKVEHKAKCIKEIVIICHDRKLQKRQKMGKHQIQRLSNKENIILNKQDNLKKVSVVKNSSKSKHKKTQSGSMKQYTSKKQLPTSDYWSCGFDPIPKSRNSSSKEKLSRNNAYKKFKQNLSPY